MKYSEFRRWLEARGVEFEPEKGSHFKISLGGKSSVFPDHGAKDWRPICADQRPVRRRRTGARNWRSRWSSRRCASVPPPRFIF